MLKFETLTQSDKYKLWKKSLTELFPSTTRESEKIMDRLAAKLSKKYPKLDGREVFNLAYSVSLQLEEGVVLDPVSFLRHANTILTHRRQTIPNLYM